MAAIRNTCKIAVSQMGRCIMTKKIHMINCTSGVWLRKSFLFPCDQESTSSPLLWSFYHTHRQYASVTSEIPDINKDKFQDRDLQSEKEDVVASVMNSEKSVNCKAKSIETVAEILLEAKASTSDVTKLLTDRPELMNYSSKQIESSVQYLRNSGFHPEDVVQLIYSYPDVITVKPNVLSQCFDLLRGLGFSEGKLQLLVAKHPALIAIQPKEVSQRYSDLMQIFRKSEINKMLYEQPNLLTDTWDSIQDRIQYVSTEMGLDQKDMIKSDLFKYSLAHIRERHLFLLRAGLYEKPDKHGVTKIENPTLEQMLRTSDKAFAQKIGKMTLEEFDAFKEILKVEIESEMKILREIEESIDSDGEEEIPNTYKKQPKPKK